MQAIHTHFYEPVFLALYSTFEPIKNKVQDVVQAIFSEIRASYALCSNRTKVTAIAYLSATLAFAVCLPVSIALKVAFVASSIIAFSGAYYVGLRMNIDSAYAEVANSQRQELEEMKNAFALATDELTKIHTKMKCSLDIYTKAIGFLFSILSSLPNFRYSESTMDDDPVLAKINLYLARALSQLPAIQEAKKTLCHELRCYPRLAANPTLEDVQQTHQATQVHHQKVKNQYLALVMITLSLTERGRKTLASIGF